MRRSWFSEAVARWLSRGVLAVGSSPLFDSGLSQQQVHRYRHCVGERFSLQFKILKAVPAGFSLDVAAHFHHKSGEGLSILIACMPHPVMLVLRGAVEKLYHL